MHQGHHDDDAPSRDDASSEARRCQHPHHQPQCQRRRQRRLVGPSADDAAAVAAFRVSATPQPPPPATDDVHSADDAEEVEATLGGEKLFGQAIAGSWCSVSTTASPSFADTPYPPPSASMMMNGSVSVPPTAIQWPAPRFGHAAVASGADTVVLFGGRNDDGFLDDLWIYSISSRSWRQVQKPPQHLNAPWPTPRCAHTLTVIPTSTAVAILYGGATTFSDTTTELWELNLLTMQWTLSDSGQPILPSSLAASSSHHHSVVTNAGGGSWHAQGFPSYVGGASLPNNMSPTPFAALGSSLPTMAATPFTTFAAMSPQAPPLAYFHHQQQHYPSDPRQQQPLGPTIAASLPPYQAYSVDPQTPQGHGADGDGSSHHLMDSSFAGNHHYQPPPPYSDASSPPQFGGYSMTAAAAGPSVHPSSSQHYHQGSSGYYNQNAMHHAVQQHGYGAWHPHQQLAALPPSYAASLPGYMASAHSHADSSAFMMVSNASVSSTNTSFFALGGGGLAGLRPMNRKGHTAVSIAGRVLVYGGATQDGAADTQVWSWSPQHAQWSMLRCASRCPHPRRFHAAEAMPDGVHMIIVGGQKVEYSAAHFVDVTGDLEAADTGGDFLNDVHLFNAFTRTWRPLQTKGQRPPPSMSCTVLIRHGALCLFDGAAEDVLPHNYYELYLATHTWRRLGQNAVPRVGASGCNKGSTVVCGNVVVMFGGHTGTAFSNELVLLRLTAPTLRKLCLHWLEQHAPSKLRLVPWATAVVVCNQPRAPLREPAVREGIDT